MPLPNLQRRKDDKRAMRLGYMTPRWIATSCITFWVALGALLMSHFVKMTPAGFIILGLLAVVSSAIVMYLGLVTMRELETQLATLARLARRDQVDETAEFAFTEFAAVASAIDQSNRAVRDEFENLRSAAFRDSVTRLPNRLSLISAIERGLADASHKTPCVLFHLILDGFKGTGDVLGATGSQDLQREVASRFSMYLATSSIGPDRRLTDSFLASLGAGQFGLFLPAGCDRKAATGLARELHALFEQPFEMNGRDIQVRVSGGIALAPDDGDTPDLLLKNASMALNEILRASKKGFQFFSPRLERLALGRSRFERELRDAVDEEAFRPVFQPKVDLLTGKIIGVEALARWHRGENRTISPGTFIPLAEELGLIDEIGFQILRQSCKSAAAWMKADMDISVAVNVSPRQFDRPDFIDRVVEALRKSGLPPHLLQLEITETMAVSNPERVISVMEPLRAMGIKLAIDDFGTGHANLSMLTKLPFDIFKIDRQFVMHIEEDPQARAIVEMILVMAEKLGLRTVAEGIETEGQANFLRERNCTVGQGFLYSQGLPDAQLRKLLMRQKTSGTYQRKSA